MRTFYIFLCITCSLILNNQVKSQDSTSVIKVNLEERNDLDAALYIEKESKNYFFHQLFYSRCSDNNLDLGYPTKIQNGWKNLPQYWNSGIDAALRCESAKKTIFFKGREYFIIQNGYQVDVFPRKLPGEFKNLPRFFHSNIDAAFCHSKNQQMYFFKGDQYVRLKNNKVEEGYPKKLPGEFKRLPKEFCSDLDAILHRNGTTLFFKNGRYAKHNKDAVLTGFQTETVPE